MIPFASHTFPSCTDPAREPEKEPVVNRISTTICLSVIAIASFTSVSLAAPNANAKIQLHLAPTTAKNACTVVQAHPACAQINTHGLLIGNDPSTYNNLYFCYVLVTDADPAAGIGGLQFGIDYGSGIADVVGVDVFNWTLCATLESLQPSPRWPQSGGGILITWPYSGFPELCQRYEPGGPGTGVVATAGYFYCGAYSDAVLAITPRPLDNMAKVIDCSGVEENIQGIGVTHTPSHLGSVGFGTIQGYNPCGLNTPVDNSTWSEVKSLYGGD